VSWVAIKEEILVELCRYLRRGTLDFRWTRRRPPFSQRGSTNYLTIFLSLQSKTWESEPVYTITLLIGVAFTKKSKSGRKLKKRGNRIALFRRSRKADRIANPRTLVKSLWPILYCLHIKIWQLDLANTIPKVIHGVLGRYNTLGMLISLWRWHHFFTDSSKIKRLTQGIRGQWTWQLWWQMFLIGSKMKCWLGLYSEWCTTWVRSMRLAWFRM